MSLHSSWVTSRTFDHTLCSITERLSNRDVSCMWPCVCTHLHFCAINVPLSVSTWYRIHYEHPNCVPQQCHMN
eukprot:m.22182 g.22182  ORF g.22182 m.22182 type:complete len:73 (+) comp8364_c0_seq1:72-290(+)